MKRSIGGTPVLVALAISLLAAVGCSRQAEEAGPTAPAAVDDGWVAPPRVQAAVRAGAAIVVSGLADPGARVVLRVDGGDAYAVAADEQGRFELPLTTPPSDALFVIETQTGQSAASAPERLFVSGDPTGPLALVSSGAASRRLDPAPALDAVDADGAALLLSGRARPGSRVSVVREDQTSLEALAGPDGRWTVRISPGGAAALTVAGRRFAYPGVSGDAGQGWRIERPLEGGARQVTWFPRR